MRQHQAKRCIDVKRLRLVFTERIACCGVAHLAQAHVTGQGAHITRSKHIAHHALGLVHEKLASLLGDDAGRILPAVLQQQQAVINQLVDGGLADNANYAAHGFSIMGLGSFKDFLPRHYRPKCAPSRGSAGRGVTSGGSYF